MKIKVKRVVVVEGKYDKIKLESLIDGVIVATNGFEIYRDKELCKLLRFYAEHCGLIVMTDSDSAGRQIRSHIKNVLPPNLRDDVVNIHIPKIVGKEKRKLKPSKEGTLGVEGIDVETLRQLLERYCNADTDCSAAENRITKNDMYMLGLSGGKDCAKKRADLAQKLDLPSGLSSSALLDVLNTLCTKEQLEKLIYNS